MKQANLLLDDGPAAHGDAAGPVRVGIAGLGRSGWGIHAEAIARQPERFRVVAVVDGDGARRREAQDRFACRAFDTVESLVRDPAVELVVVATPNHLHAAHAVLAVGAGKDVLCEKPMAGGGDEAEGMIAAARRAGRVLTVFNNRRFDPHFLRLREVVDSSVLGRIVQVRLAVHQFTRRWDWQTLTEFGGGMLNNIGAHWLDLLLSFFPGPGLPEAHCHLDRVLTLGDADDHCVVTLRRSGDPLVQLELTNACALPQENWLVMGSRGTLAGTFDALRWRVAEMDRLPPRELQRSPRSAERTYNHDAVTWQEHAWQVPAEQAGNRWQHDQFYRRLHGTLRLGEPLAVTPESVLRCRRLIDACHASAAAAPPAAVAAMPDPTTPARTT
jgi:scyllo-inositol 2-dehydrogenase (NADP+)